MPIVIFGTIFTVYYFTKNKIKENKSLSKIFGIIKIFSCIAIICFLGIKIAIISYPKHNENKDDYIFVLGAGLYNGETPNLILTERLDAAIKYIEENGAKYIVLSGGKGIDVEIPESQAMSKYLQEKSAGMEKIIEENESKNTNKNFKYSKGKIEEYSHKSLNEVSVKIVTTDFHALEVVF